MNCQLCQKESEAYREGNLPHDIRTQIEAHLKVCEECAESYKLQTLADRVIKHEKESLSNPFISTRIMARIENPEPHVFNTKPLLGRVLKPAFITFTLAAAIFYGVLIGNIYQPNDISMQIPLELALIDDAAIESVNMLSIE